MGADLSYVEAAVTALAPHLTRKALIVGKSTVPVGTAEWVEQLVGKHAPAELGVEVAWSPEFLQEGFAVEDVLRPNRIVVGVKSEWANAMLYAAHKGVFDLAATEDREVPLVVTDFATAELVKVAANAFLATKISFINAMAEVCEAAGGDVTQLARAIGYDARIGNKFLRAGIGFGGGCLPKDIRAFQARAQELGAGEALRFLHEVDLINLRRRSRVVQLAAELLGRRVRPGRPGPVRHPDRACSARPSSPTPTTSATRPRWPSPACSPRPAPRSPSTTRRAWRTPAGRCPSRATPASMIDAVPGADLVCVLTEWADFRNADPVALGELVAGRRVVDGRNCLDPHCGPGRLGVPGHGPLIRLAPAPVLAATALVAAATALVAAATALVAAARALVAAAGAGWFWPPRVPRTSPVDADSSMPPRAPQPSVSSWTRTRVRPAGASPTRAAATGAAGRTTPSRRGCTTCARRWPASMTRAGG